jgi:plasmid maintenance system antidote protein VapI
MKQPVKKLHIGELIKATVDERKMKVTGFASQLNRSSQSVYNIFNSETCDTGLLAEISKVLKTDFFKYYQESAGLVEAPAKVKKGRGVREIGLYIKIDDVTIQEQILKQVGITLK